MTAPLTRSGRPNTSGTRGGLTGLSPLPLAEEEYSKDNEQKTRSQVVDFLASLRRQLAALSSLVAAATPSTQTANHTLALTDADRIVEMNLAGANTLTVPPDVDVPFPLGTEIPWTQYGAGQVTLTPGAGVTLRSRVGLKTAGQYAVGRVYKRATNEWVASGDLTP